MAPNAEPNCSSKDPGWFVPALLDRFLGREGVRPVEAWQGWTSSEMTGS